jgi:hypothetical protein
MLKRILVVLIIFISGISLAQEGTTSPYSFYGIGEIKFKGTAENRAMGGIGVLTDSIHINLQNPAGLADLKLINYSVGASHRYLTLDTDAEKQRTSTTSLDYIAIGIPMGKFGASFGLIPFTSVGYQIDSSTEGTTTQFTGTGGLNRAFLSLGYKVTPKLSVGVETSYNFGNIENTSFNHVLDEFQYGTKIVNKSDILGFSFKFGAFYKTMVSEKLELTTSATFTPENDFVIENFKQVSSVIRNDLGIDLTAYEFEIIVEDTNLKYPSQFTIGAGIGKSKSWFVGAEYTGIKTSNFANSAFSIADVTYTDASNFGIGGYYIPNYNSIGKYWSRVVYRAGIRYEETGINIRGEDINEFGISFGVGLPVGRIFSNLNLGFELGQRGTKNQGLVKENFFNTIISLSLNDRWFEKRYYD